MLTFASSVSCINLKGDDDEDSGFDNFYGNRRQAALIVDAGTAGVFMHVLIRVLAFPLVQSGDDYTF